MGDKIFIISIYFFHQISNNKFPIYFFISGKG